MSLSQNEKFFQNRRHKSIFDLEFTYWHPPTEEGWGGANSKIDFNALVWKNSHFATGSLWLETLNTKEINGNLITENNKLRAAFYQVIDILDSELSNPI